MIEYHGDGNAYSHAYDECHLTAAAERVAAEEGDDKGQQSDEHRQRMTAMRGWGSVVSFVSAIGYVAFLFYLPIVCYSCARIVQLQARARLIDVQAL